MDSGSKEIWKYRTGAIYKRTLMYKVPTTHPLFGCSYFGQVVRKGSDILKNVRKRWQEENNERPREVGLTALIKEFGADCLHNSIVEVFCLPKKAAHVHANNREIHHIFVNGGKLRDVECKCKQTLNLTNGGQFGAQSQFHGVEALQSQRWKNFKEAILFYISTTGNCAVPRSFVTPSGLKLGNLFHNVRQGHLVDNRPDRLAFLAALPGWYYDANDSCSIKKMARSRTIAQRQSEGPERRSEIAKKGYSTSMERGHKSLPERYTEWVKTPEGFEKMSLASKKSWTIERRILQSTNSKEQFKRELENGVAEQRKLKMQRITELKRVERQSGMNELELKADQAQVERNKLKTIKRKQRLQKLRSIPGNENASLRDVAAARREGIID